MEGISLISTLAIGFGVALVLGFLAEKLKVPALVGYLLAGILVSPSVFGFDVDLNLANQLAEIGIMLLMFYLTFNVIGAWLQSLLAAGIDKLSALADSALTGLF